MGYIKTCLLLSVLTFLFIFVGFAIAGESGAMIAFVIAFMMNIFAYWNSDKIILKMYKAKQIDTNKNQKLYQNIKKLVEYAQLPLPKLYIIDNPQPNAFATGRNPENGAVAITTGLLNMLNEDEVLAVVAHELAHIKNRDTLIMTITATLAGAISMLANFAFFFGGNRGRGGHPIVMILIAIIAPLAAMLVQMAISRRREYAADFVGAKI